MTHHASPSHPAEIYTGRAYINLLDPDPASFDLSEIFRALSRLPRFTGHGDTVVTVGNHLLTCLAIAARRGEPVEVRRAVLMHDAAEAYLGDVSSPLKALLPEYRAIEARMEAAIFERFKISTLYKSRVRAIDLMALALEKREVMPTAGPWPCDVDVSGLGGCLIRGNSPATVAFVLNRHARDLGVVQ